MQVSSDRQWHPSDRLLRHSILVSTAVLPRSARVSARRSLLSRLELGRAHRAGLIIVGHPKCGGTWLRVMISRAFQFRHSIPGHIVAKTDELHRRNANIPRLLSTNGSYSYERIIADALESNPPDPSLSAKPIVLLARHPCDIAVSWYIQFTKRQSPYKNELINAELRNPVDRKNVERWEFVMNEELGLPHLIEFFNNWQKRLATVERPLLVRYEDLRADPIPDLRRIGNLMDAGFTDDELIEARDFASFDNLKKLETEGYFRNGGLSLRNRNDPDTFKVRRGKVGGFRDYFEPEQVETMERMVRERLWPGFGYSGEEIQDLRGSSAG